MPGSRFAQASLALCLMIVAPAHAIRVRHDVPISAYNQLASQEHLGAVGQVRAGSMGCTGVLVAPNLVLTAAHCVVDAAGRRIPTAQVSFRVDPPNGPARTYRAAFVDVHPDYEPDAGPSTDIALITLSQDVTIVDPLPVTTANPRDRVATLVGYGTQGTGNDPTSRTSIPGARRRLAAQNVIDRVRFDGGAPGNYAIHMDFDQPGRLDRSSTGDAVPLPLEGGASFGDSGSPLLVDFGGRDYVVGVASYIYGIGRPGPAGYGEVSGYQWVGPDRVSMWLAMHGVDIVHSPQDQLPDVQDTGTGAGPADIDRDGVTDARDAALLLERLAARDARADLNADGFSDVRDAATLLEALGFDRASYPKKRDWKRAVRAYFRSQVRPFMTGANRRELARAERTLKQAWRHLAP
ncbi:MAG: hypothetical protein Tsb0013_03450 [Phycisphaerales bacterium]